MYQRDYPCTPNPTTWRCCVASLRWALGAHGFAVDPDWLMGLFLDRDLIVPEVGTIDKTGRDLSAFINDAFGRLGFVADAMPDASWDWVVAATRRSPGLIYGEAWKHWTAVRGTAHNGRTLHLANPNPGYRAVAHYLPQKAYPLLGPIHLTVIRRRARRPL